MSSPQLLEATFNNASIPHQPYVVISDEPTFGGVPLMREMIKRSVSRASPVLLISVLRPSSTYITKRHISSSDLQIIDLSERIPGYGNDDDFSTIKADIIRAAEKLGPRVEIYIDTIDILAEDYTSGEVLQLIRAILKLIKQNKAPSRLTLLSSPHSPFTPALLLPTLSASLTYLQPHHLSLLTSLSTAYLAPIGPSHRFLDLLDTAIERKSGEQLAWTYGTGLGDWSELPKTNGKGKMGDMDQTGIAAVQVILRKATGGLKGMNKSLEGVTVSSIKNMDISISTSSSSSSSLNPNLELSAIPLESIINLTPFSNPSTSSNPSASSTGNTTQSTHPAPTPTPSSTHTTSLDLSFNLNLTDDQRRRRDRVPIPYVHEGEGVEVGWEIEEEEDDDDDEEI